MFNFVYEFLARLGYTHPIHPTEVHMPIGLVVGAFIFAWIAVIFHRRMNLALTARHCVVLAAIWVFPTILFGVMDWLHYYAGAMLFPIKMKLIFAPALTILLWIAVVLGYKKGPTYKPVIALYCACFVIVVILGYFGGQLVYGTKASPPPENVKAGAKVFSANCAGCHPHGGNVIKPNLPLRSAPQLAEFKSFEDFIRDPKLPDGSKGPMPAFPPSKISDQQAKELYEYIRQVIVHPKRK
ncbi:MAG: c-type cytochrome [Desulfobacterales bacterium]